jgi:hypothetical protein
MRVETVTSYSEEPTSDYQTLLRDGWVDTGKAPSVIKCLDRRVMKRTQEQALAEEQRTQQLQRDAWNKLTPAQKRIRKEHHVLRSRGLDV